MFTQEELNNLLTEVGKEFSTHLAKAEESFKLAKSEDFPPKKEESKEEKPSESKEEPKAEAKPEGKPEDKPAEAPAAEGEKPAMEGEQPPMEGEQKPEMAAEGESHGYDEEDMKHMEAMYASMSKPELKAHHDCIRKCMDSMGLAKCEEGMAKSELEDAAKDAEGYRPNGGPKEGEAASSKTPVSSDGQAVEKSEPSVEVSLLKSEIEALKAKSADEKKALETAMQNFLTKFVEKTAPAGKAITSLDIIAKNENGQKDKVLSKSEIDAKLLEAAKNPSLQKSDRDAINGYYFSKNIEQVRHLL